MIKKRSLHYILCFSILILGTYSCSHQGKKGNGKNLDTDKKEQSVKNLSGYKKMLAIDSTLDKTHVVMSLRWQIETEKHGLAFTEVKAYIDDDGIPVKIVQDFHDGEYQPEGSMSFYLENNKIIYWKEEKSVWVDSLNAKYVQKRTIYNNGKPSISQERTADSYDNIINLAWNKIATKVPSMKEARAILEGEGRFKLYFISVINANNLYLLLGENKNDTKNRYTTAVEVPKKTPFINDLLKHLKEYKFRPVQIQFNIVGDGVNQPRTRVLNGIKWVDNK